MLDRITVNTNYEPENLHTAMYEGVIVNSICSQAFLLGNDMGRFKRTVGPLCACGCGNPVIWNKRNKKWNNFINGHNDKRNILTPKPPDSEAPLCKCGCGQRVKWRAGKWGEYANISHINRSENYCEKPSDSQAPLCACGCGKQIKWNRDKNRWNKYILGHYIQDNNPMDNPKSVAKFLGNQYAKNSKRTKEWCRIRSEKYKKNGNPNFNEEYVEIKAKGPPLCACGCNKKTKWNGKNYNKFIQGHYCHINHPSKKPENQKAKSEYMLNGGAAHALSFIKNPSSPQIELYKLIKLLYPNAILNYPSLNRSIDIAIPDRMIAIEYDGSYWHNKEKDKIRQTELEAIGWSFLRYCDYIPSMNELEKDLQQMNFIDDLY